MTKKFAYGSEWMTSGNRVVTLWFVLILTLGWALSVCAQTNPNNRTQPDRGWPRRFEVAGISFAVYQPQVEEWIDNRFSARAAFQVSEGQKKQPSYGVVWFSARTEIDKTSSGWHGYSGDLEIGKRDYSIGRFDVYAGKICLIDVILSPAS